MWRALQAAGIHGVFGPGTSTQEIVDFINAALVGTGARA